MYEHDGKRYRLGESRRDELGTLFGRVPFERRVGRLCSSGRAAADLPLDRELGLTGGFTSTVVCGIARLCAQMPFEAAREQWRSTYGWAPAPRSVHRMVDALGGEVPEFVAAAPAPTDDGEVLVIQVDAGGAPMIDPVELSRRQQPKRARSETRAERNERRAAKAPPRRTKGQKSKNSTNVDLYPKDLADSCGKDLADSCVQEQAPGAPLIAAGWAVTWRAQ